MRSGADHASLLWTTASVGVAEWGSTIQADFVYCSRRKQREQRLLTGKFRLGFAGLTTKEEMEYVSALYSI